MAAHPSEFLAGADVDLLRARAAEAEQLGRLHPDQLDCIFRNKWFGLFVPTPLGGRGNDLISGLRILEALAWADGSTGWTVTLCSGAAWFVGFIEPASATEIFSNRKACLAGSGFPGGTAVLFKNGYEVSGHWRYATGAPHATVFTANCVLEDGTMKAFWFHRDEVVLQNEWRPMGMIATGSQSFTVTKLRVPANRVFEIDPAKAVRPQPVYQVPFQAYADCTLAVNTAGMAMRFLELFIDLTPEDQRPGQRGEDIMAGLAAARSEFYDMVGVLCERLNSGDTDPAYGKDASRSALAMHSAATELIDTLFPLSGMVAAQHDTEINRVWRNFHTAGQHKLLARP